MQNDEYVNVELAVKHGESGATKAVGLLMAISIIMAFASVAGAVWHFFG
jgi:hypothetical protein